MKKWTTLLIGLTILLLAAAACGGEPATDRTPAPTATATPTVVGPISGVGPGISIGEALNSNLQGPLLVNGHLHAQDDQVRLCELLAESFPPQCGGGTLVVEGLDLTTMDGLTSEGSVTWSDQLVQVLGTVEGEVLTVAATVR